MYRDFFYLFFIYLIPLVNTNTFWPSIITEPVTEITVNVGLDHKPNLVGVQFAVKKPDFDNAF